MKWVKLKKKKATDELAMHNFNEKKAPRKREREGRKRNSEMHNEWSEEDEEEAVFGTKHAIASSASNHLTYYNVSQTLSKRIHWIEKKNNIIKNGIKLIIQTFPNRRASSKAKIISSRKNPNISCCNHQLKISLEEFLKKTHFFQLSRPRRWFFGHLQAFRSKIWFAEKNSKNSSNLNPIRSHFGHRTKTAAFLKAKPLYFLFTHSGGFGKVVY